MSDSLLIHDDDGYETAIPIGRTQADLEANARLIAAAPDMFAALESLRASLPELEDPNEPLPGTAAVDVLCEHWPRILEAIHKAEGEA